MGLFSGYDGKGLNHAETLYQRAERQLAMDLVRLLGCTPVETPQRSERGRPISACTPTMPIGTA